MCIPIQTEGMSDEDYCRLLAEQTEQELIQAKARVGVMFNAPRIECAPTKRSYTYNPANRSPRELEALDICRQQRHDEAVHNYNSNPKLCLVCGDPIPYERRHVFTCSKECERMNVTEEEYYASPKHCSKCGKVIPYTSRRLNVCNDCKVNNVREEYEAHPKLCKGCGAPVPYENRDGCYCSRGCMIRDQAKMREEANARSHQRAVERYMANPHYCRKCGKLVPYERRRGYTCSVECAKATLSDEERRARACARTKAYTKAHAARRKDYMRDYHATHKEQRRIHDHTYYIKHRDAVLAKNAKWAANHADEVAAYQKQYRIDHKEEIAAQKAQHYAEVKLGKAICSACGREYDVTNKSTTLCQDCLQDAYAVAKNDSDYEGTDGMRHREILRAIGRLTPDVDNSGFAVHHADGIKDHNEDYDNLIILSRGDHTRIHNLYRTELKRAKEQGREPMSLDQFTRETIKNLNIQTR